MDDPMKDERHGLLINGTIFHSDGETPFQDARVTLERGEFNYEYHGVYDVWTDENGSFELYVHGPGYYHIRVDETWEYYWIKSDIMYIDPAVDDNMTLDFTFEDKSPETLEFTGSVIDSATNTKIPNANIHIWGTDLTGRDRSNGTTTDDEGDYRISVAQGAYRFHVNVEGYYNFDDPEDYAFLIVQDTDLDITLDPLLPLDRTITLLFQDSETGLPVENVHVNVEGKDANGYDSWRWNFQHEMWSDENGTIVYEVPKGKWELRWEHHPKYHDLDDHMTWDIGDSVSETIDLVPLLNETVMFRGMLQLEDGTPLQNVEVSMNGEDATGLRYWNWTRIDNGSFKLPSPPGLMGIEFRLDTSPQIPQNSLWWRSWEIVGMEGRYNVTDGDVVWVNLTIPSFSESFSGIVVDEDDVPIEDANVRIWGWNDDGYEMEHYSHTASDGTFTIESFPGHYDWEAHAEGHYSNRSHEGPIDDLDITIVLEKELSATVSIEGVVTDSDGQPMNDVRVEIHGHDTKGYWESYFAETGSNGYYGTDIRPGEWIIRLDTDEGYLKQDWFMAADGDDITKDIQLMAGHTLTLKFKTPSGETIQGGHVRAWNNDDYWFDKDMWHDGGISVVKVPVPEGKVWIEYNKDDWFIRDYLLNVTGDMTLAIEVLQALPRDAKVMGYITNETGVAINAEIDIHPDGDDPQRFGEHRRADMDGYFEMELAAGVYRVEIWGEGVHDKEIETFGISPGDNWLNITLTEPMEETSLLVGEAFAEGVSFDWYILHIEGRDTEGYEWGMKFDPEWDPVEETFHSPMTQVGEFEVSLPPGTFEYAFWAPGYELVFGEINVSDAETVEVYANLTPLVDAYDSEVMVTVGEGIALQMVMLQDCSMMDDEGSDDEAPERIYILEEPGMAFTVEWYEGYGIAMVSGVAFDAAPPWEQGPSDDCEDCKDWYDFNFNVALEFWADDDGSMVIDEDWVIEQWEHQESFNGPGMDGRDGYEQYMKELCEMPWPPEDDVETPDDNTTTPEVEDIVDLNAMFSCTDPCTMNTLKTKTVLFKLSNLGTDTMNLSVKLMDTTAAPFALAESWNVTLVAGASTNMGIQLYADELTTGGNYNLTVEVSIEGMDTVEVHSIDVKVVQVPAITVDIQGGTSEFTVEPGNSVTFTLALTNDGLHNDTFDLEAEKVGDVSWVTFGRSQITLAAGATETIEVNVTVPSNLASNDYQAVLLTTSQATGVKESTNVDIHVQQNEDNTDRENRDNESTVPGFEGVFGVVALLGVALLVRRK